MRQSQNPKRECEDVMKVFSRLQRLISYNIIIRDMRQFVFNAELIRSFVLFVKHGHNGIKRQQCTFLSCTDFGFFEQMEYDISFWNNSKITKFPPKEIKNDFLDIFEGKNNLLEYEKSQLTFFVR